MPGPITWQNVTAPNFSGTDDLYRTAGQLINNGFGGLADALGKYTAQRQDQANSALLANAAKFRDLGSLQGGISSGAVLAGVDPSLVTADTWKALDNHATNLISNATSQNNLDFNKATFDSRAAQEAAKPGFIRSETAHNNASAGNLNEATDYNRMTEADRQRALQAGTGLTNAHAANINQQVDQSAQRFPYEMQGTQDGYMGQSAAQAVIGAGKTLEQRLYAFNNSPQIQALSPGARATAEKLIRAAPEGGGDSISGGSVPALNIPGLPAPVGNTTRVGGTSPEAYRSALASGDVSAALRASEGLRTDPYWDVNHWRTGYGSDTITNPDGSSTPVGGANGANPNVKPNVAITPQQAEADLTRRTNDYTKATRQAIGPAWDNFSPSTQAALTSMAYNYGHVPDNVAKAAKTGDPASIAMAIAAHAGDNNGANYARRAAEANAVLGGGAGGGNAPAGTRAPSSGSDYSGDDQLLAENRAYATRSTVANTNLQSDITKSQTGGIAGQYGKAFFNTEATPGSVAADLRDGEANKEGKREKGSGPLADYEPHQVMNAVNNMSDYAKSLGVDINPAIAGQLVQRYARGKNSVWFQNLLNRDTIDPTQRSGLDDEIKRIGDESTTGRFAQYQSGQIAGAAAQNLNDAYTARKSAADELQAAFQTARSDPKKAWIVDAARTKLNRANELLQQSVGRAEAMHGKGKPDAESAKAAPDTGRAAASDNGAPTALAAAASPPPPQAQPAQLGVRPENVGAGPAAGVNPTLGGDAAAAQNQREAQIVTEAAKTAGRSSQASAALRRAVTLSMPDQPASTPGLDPWAGSVPVADPWEVQRQAQSIAARKAAAILALEAAKSSKKSEPWLQIGHPNLAAILPAALLRALGQGDSHPKW